MRRGQLDGVGEALGSQPDSRIPFWFFWARRPAQTKFLGRGGCGGGVVGVEEPEQPGSSWARVEAPTRLALDHQ